MDEQRSIRAWLIGSVVFLSLLGLGHSALLVLGFDSNKVCCIFSGVVVLLNFVIALIAAMFGIIAGHEYAQRPTHQND